MNVYIVLLLAVCYIGTSVGEQEIPGHESTTELFITTTDDLPSTTEVPMDDGTISPDAIDTMDNEVQVRKRRKVSNQAAKFSKLMTLVKASKLQDCAGRVVCDLNCDPQKHGSDGKRVLSNLEKLQSSGQIKESDLQFYVKAAVTGRKYKKPKTCSKCGDDYPNCPAPVSDMVAVASLIKLTS